MSRVIGFYAPDKEYGYMSNWYPCTFQFGKYTYSSSEQFMMAQKAALFRDYDTFFKILDTTDQGKIKRLGKQVSNYNDAVWDRLRGPMMRRGLRAKFQQNPELMEQLLATGNDILAECSPSDKIWGIGLAVDDKRIQNLEKWKGRNLLGTVLMQVRSDLRCWSAIAPDDMAFVNAWELPANEIWAMPFGHVCQLPRVREAINIYADVVHSNIRPGYDYDLFDEYYGTLEGLEESMNTNMGGGLPIAWFFEMKQDIYDMVRYNSY